MYLEHRLLNDKSDQKTHFLSWKIVFLILLFTNFSTQKLQNWIPQQQPEKQCIFLAAKSQPLFLFLFFFLFLDVLFIEWINFSKTGEKLPTFSASSFHIWQFEDSWDTRSICCIKHLVCKKGLDYV